MSPTNNFQSPFQTSTSISSLVSLDVPHSSSHKLSSISKHLPSLRSLCVDCGSELRFSQDVTTILDALETTASASQVANIETSALIQFCSRVHVSGSNNSLKSLLIQMGMNCQFTNTLKEKILQNLDINGCGGCFLPGDSYPNWLTFSCEGSSVTFKVPQVEGRNLKSMICIVYTSTQDNITSDGLKNILVINHTKTTIHLYKREALTSFENEEWQNVVSNVAPGDKVELMVVFESRFIVKKTIVYLMYDEPIGSKMDQSLCSGDENEYALRRTTDEFKENKKKKIRVE